ncbi:unnamed protein product [Arabis nemorensis]|uniref:NYN domain-containing protein n=1 Tax=Arabis nemorensis TaxID=586526 RepID=A0A565CLS1_9BRAS|nr:unnamed protein product [Arabis nemorensis]
MVFLAGPCTRVYWDVVDFPFPDGVDPSLIYQNMQLFLEEKGFLGELSIMAYVDKENFADELIDVYENSGITIIHHPHLDWAYSHYNVLLAMPQLSEVLPSKLHTVSFDCLSTRLLDGGKPIDSPVETIFTETIFTGPCTRVFWDVVDFPFPNGVDPALIYQNMKLILENKGFLGELSIMAYVDKENFADELLDVYGITIIHHPHQGDTYARVDKTDFLNALEALEDRYYNVLLALPQDLSSSELHTVSFEWLSTSLLDQSGTLQGLNHEWNHKRKSREENVGFSDGLATLDPQQFSRSQITVFWDVQDCVTKIGSALRGKGYHGEVLIRPYVDGDFQWQWVPDSDCRDMDVDLLTRVDRNKYAKVTRMLLDLLFWAMNNDDIPQSFMLILKPDTKCNSVIKALEHRGFNLILGPSDEVSLQLCKSPPDGKKRINQSIKLQGRKLTEVSRKHARSSIAVFWLLGEDCPSNPTLMRWNIESTLEKKGYTEIVSFTVYVDEGKLSNELEHAYYNSGMSVQPVPEEFGRTKIDIMAWDMIKWTFSISEPSHFLVIAKPFQDVVLDCLLEDFERRGLNVLFELPDYMVSFGSSVWSAKSLLDGSCSAPI